jgi:GR25 family glycosyltransferase involved in LPS biosynthesis
VMIERVRGERERGDHTSLSNITMTQITLRYVRAVIQLCFLCCLLRQVALIIQHENMSSSQPQTRPFWDNVKPNVVASGDRGRLPVYWINQDTSIDKDNEFFLGNRFTAIDTAQIKQMHNEQNIIFHKKALLDETQANDPAWKIHATNANEIFYQEAAHLLSHLTAIYRAYLSGHEMVLIIEDGIELKQDFLVHWRAYAKLAPKGWNVLQWFTDNDVVVQHGLTLAENKDPWISWLPDHDSCRAYMIRREGMRQILDLTLSSDTKDGPVKWKMDEPGMITADELIYYYAKNTYTSTYPWFGPARDARTRRIPTQTIDYKSFTGSTLRSETILVIGNLRMKHEDSVTAEIERLVEDVEALSVWHTNSTWVVNAVLTESSLEPFFQNRTANLPPNIDLRVQVNDKPFNKWEIFASLAAEMTSYDYVLQKDSDQRLAGFPWNTFMETKGGALIAGPLRQVVEESLKRFGNQRKNQDCLLYDAQRWKRVAKFTSMFTNVTSFRVPFLEQYFVLIQGNFAQWFFQQVLTPDYLAQPTDFGLDLMWCAAAETFNPTQTPSCSLVPVVSLHEDSRSMGSKETYTAMGLDTLRRLGSSNPVFKTWMDKSRCITP